MTVKEAKEWFSNNETTIIESINVIKEHDPQKWIGFKSRLTIT